MCSTRGRKLQVEFVQRTEHIGRDIGITPVAGSPMELLVDLDRFEAGQQELQRDARLGAR